MFRNSDTPEFTLVHEITPQPPRVGPVTITVGIKEFSGPPVTGCHLKLEANMSHAGMAPVFAEASETEPGRYRSVMDLSMAGDWHVKVQVTLPEGRNFYHDFEIKGVEP
jgi:hypothetical protein